MVHICGYGNEKQVEDIRSEIHKVSRNGGNILYEGLLYGDSFIRMIQKCDIGLCPQDPDAAFNNTSFPSKVLTYLANGLKVVTIDIPAIKDSAVGSILTYYRQQTPELLKEAIERCANCRVYDSRSVLDKLDKGLLLDFERVLNK